MNRFESDSYSNRFGSEHSIQLAGAQHEGIIGMQVRKISGLIVRELKFHNLITNAALEILGTRNNSGIATETNTCRVGTGSTPPAPTQTSLVSPVGTSSTAGVTKSSGNSGSDPYYYRLVREYVFNPGQATGNLAEIGFFSLYSSPSNLMGSRALILDELGNPTTLTVLPDEYLYVTYEIRVHVGSLADVQTSIVLGSETYDVNIRKLGVAQNDGLWTTGRSPWITSPYQVTNSDAQPAVTESFLPSGVSAGSGNVQPYVSGTMRRSVSCVYSPTVGNVAGGIRMLSVTGSGWQGFSLLFDKPIPKDNTKTLSFMFTTQWGRYVP